ncbi:MAG TPA: DUF4097 family beta strand repeat-containing protein [Bryobacteraceae bacterium]|jgi:DUF4097 and DUF4098 domain-containing protein YvlB
MIGVLRGTCVALLAVLAGSSLNANVIGVPQAMFRQTYALGPNGRVTIQNLYGDVRITAWDRDEVLVEAIKRAPDPRRLGDAQIVVDSSTGQLSIHTQYAGADVDRPASVEYRITVPRSTNLENVKLVNGGLSISGVIGPVKASAINGSIRAERLEGQADLSTVNGRLDADFERISPQNPISLTSINGPIQLSLPAGAGANLIASNTSGGIDSDVGRVCRVSGGHRLRAMVNRGGAPIHLRNVNGGIAIRSNWTRRPAHPMS